jgi:lipid A ethanolaminephosphotransferase
VVRLTKTPANLLVPSLKVAAIVLWLGVTHGLWVADIGGTLHGLLSMTRYGKVPAIYASVVALALPGLIVTPFLRKTVLRVPLVALFLFASMADAIAVAISATHLDTSYLRTLWQARELTGQVFSAYWPAIVRYAVAAAALCVPLAWPPQRGLGDRFALVPLAAIIAVTIHYWSWGSLIEAYPTPLVLPVRVAWILHEPQTQNDLPLKPVSTHPSSPATFRKIVLIVDESVRGDYLSINNAAIDTTPFLQGSAGRLINFGIAVSGANCSFQSRWMLRRGMRPWQLPARDVSSGPEVGINDGPRTTFWQFAKSAGFRTMHIDGPSSFYGRFHDGMTVAEREFIDRRVAMEDAQRFERDREAARTLVSILNDAEPTFVLLDKVGVHFPYDSSTPPDYNRFHRADGARFEYARNTGDDVIGSYKNAIAWSVDEFFRQLLPGVDLRGVLILYTSDHGQNFGTTGHWVQSHCTVSKTDPSEAWVPLFAIAGQNDFSKALAASAARSHDGADHFEIFPTLLIAMGYDPTWATETYGSSLLRIPDDHPRRFLIGDVMGPGWRRWLDAAAAAER